MRTTILRQPAVTAASGFSRSTLYSLIKQGLYTKPIKVTERSSGWPNHEVSALIRARISGHSTEEIRNLVRYLEKTRHFAVTGWGNESTEAGAEIIYTPSGLLDAMEGR
jgi:prophage regulatory protein